MELTQIYNKHSTKSAARLNLARWCNKLELLDTKHFNTVSLTESSITMRRILLAVDLQNDFIDGSLSVPGAAGVIPVIDAAKHDYDMVYFTLDWHSAGHCSFREQGGPWPVHCVHHTHGAAIPDCLLQGMDEGKMRFYLKGQLVEQYGAFADVTPSQQDWFRPGDEVTVCGIASEYCVLETVKNVQALAESIGFKVRLWLDATAKFDNFDSLLEFARQKGLEV